MKNYITHLVECQCILPIYKKHTKPVYHKFSVFSELDEQNKIIEKYVSCNNCDSIHLVNEVSKSEILWGKDQYKSFTNKVEDVKFNLNSLGHERIVSILEQNNCDINIWEKAYFIIQNEIEDNIIISKEEFEDIFLLKTIEFKNNKFTIKNERYQKVINLK